MQNYSPLNTANWQSNLTNKNMNGYSISKDQIFTLNERVTNLNLDINGQKQSQKVNHEAKMKQLDEKIRRSKQIEESRLKKINDNIQQVSDNLGAQKVARELLEERKNKEVKLIEQQLNLQVNQEKQKIKQKCHEMLGNIEERSLAIRNDLVREKKLRQEEEDQTYQEVADELAGIRAELNQEKQEKEYIIQDIISKMGDQIVNIQDSISMQKKAREDSQADIIKMLDDLDFMLCQELNNEKKAREDNEEVFLKLLEDTCQKIEMGLKY